MLYRLLYSVVISLALLGATFSLYGQDQAYSTNPEEFIDQIEDQLTKGKRTNLVKLSEKLVLMWTEQKMFSEEQQKTIIEMCNLMDEKRMRITPHFYNYLQSLVNMFENGYSDRFGAWHRMLKHVIRTSDRGRIRPFETFTDVSMDLFKNHSLLISAGKTWHAGNSDFALTYDKDSLPIVRFNQLDLYGYTRGDTIVIHDTKGDYYPLELTWKGEGGKATWERAQLPPEDVYAKLSNYEIHTDRSKFKADSVDFYYKTFFGSNAIEGQYNNQLIPDYDTTRPTFPTFKSYQQKMSIENVAPNVNYHGGFSLVGNRVVGTGKVTDKATLKFFRNDSLFILAESKRFTINRSKEVASKSAETTVYFGKDSIYHPGLELRLHIPSEIVTMRRGETGRAKTSFSDSYHKLNFRVEALRWKLGASKLELAMLRGAGEVPSVFESWNYFEIDLFEEFQGIMSYNPISQIKLYAEKNDTRQMYTEKLAKFINPNLSASSIRNMLFKLMEAGFIYYDPDQDLITVRPKTYNYVYANAGMIDYDHIQFFGSVKKETHGELNLDNYELKAYGIPKVRLSKKHKVIIVPKNQTVIFKRNRNMSFAGGQVITQAGAMKIFGKPYDFNYAKFRLHLQQVDSFVIHLPDPEHTDVYGDPNLYPVHTPIEDMKAVLQIDKPNNKSGRKDYPGYPKLKSTKPSYTHYDQKHIHGGVYEPDNFYFKLDTFSIDSLNDFQPSAIHFPGEFHSADIFPTLRDTLILRPDTSLGFKKRTPKEGYPVYKGKGTFYQNFDLSNKGLRGSGKFDYLPSTSRSDSVIFFPDSMNARTQSFNLPKTTYQGTRFPKVEGNDLHTHWEPYNDEMYMTTRSKPFKMYEEQSEMSGTLVLTPRGIRGQGAFEFAGAEMSSNSFFFTMDDMSADSMDVKINSKISEGYAFTAKNVKGDVDIKNREATFIANDKKRMNSFPENQYITRSDKFHWDVDNHKLSFETTTPDKPRFVSTHPKQDSLQFRGQSGSLDLQENRITISGVEYIPVADAQLYPDSQMVYIRPKAEMEELLEAKIKADTSHFYHDFYEANATVKSRYKYKADAQYDYINESGKAQQIYFYEIFTEQDTDDIYRTHGTGLIESVDSFELNPDIGFKGRVHLFAPEKYLNYDGYARLQYDNDYINTQWFNLEARVNPHDFIINFDEPHNPGNAPLFSGFHYSRPPNYTLYPTLLNQKKSRTDHDIFNIETGLLEHDPTRNHYIMGDSSKVLLDELTGKKLLFKPISNTIYTEGKYELGMDYRDHITYHSAGNALHNLEKQSFDFSLIMAMNFPFDKELLEALHKNIKDITYSQPDVDYSTESFKKAMAELVNEETYSEMKNELLKSGTFPAPKKYEKTTLFFTDLKLAWDTLTSSYRSTEPIGVGFINGMPLHKKLKAYMEVGRARSGDFMKLYIEGSSGMEWYYFYYKKNMLYVFSSNQEFINKLMDLPKRKRKFKGESGYTYRYTGSTSPRRAKEFVNQMKNFQDISHKK